VRTRLVVPPGIAEDRLRTEALADEKVRPWLASREVARVVVVPGRLVNIVTRGAGSPA
jgi:leucyl-tRNA synthetase